MSTPIEKIDAALAERREEQKRFERIVGAEAKVIAAAKEWAACEEDNDIAERKVLIRAVVTLEEAEKS